MTASIIDFPPRPVLADVEVHHDPVIPDNPEQEDAPDALFQCDCGGSTFMIRADGMAECSACESIANTNAGAWVAGPTLRAAGRANVLDAPPVDPRPIQIGVTRLESWWKARLAQGVEFVMVALTNGTVSTWASDSRPETEDWIRRKLDIAQDIYRPVEQGEAQERQS